MNRLKFITIISLAVLVNFSSCSGLNKGEIAKIDHSFSGCFGSEKNKLILYEESGSTYAKLETNGKVVRYTKLSTEQIEAFNEFVSDLNNLKESEGCTNVEEYVLHDKTGIIRKVDGGCNWGGFNSLKQDIFGDTEK